MSRGEAKRESDEGLAGRQQCPDPGEPGGCSVTERMALATEASVTEFWKGPSESSMWAARGHGPREAGGWG